MSGGPRNFRTLRHLVEYTREQARAKPLSRPDATRAEECAALELEADAWDLLVGRPAREQRRRERGW